MGSADDRKATVNSQMKNYYEATTIQKVCAPKQDFHLRQNISMSAPLLTKETIL